MPVHGLAQSYSLLADSYTAVNISDYVYGVACNAHAIVL